MSRSLLRAGAFVCVLALATACDSPPASDLLAPDNGSSEVIDGSVIDSNVFLLPPIGESYTAIDFDEYALTRVEVCSLDDPYAGSKPLSEYTAEEWLDLEDAECLGDLDPPQEDPWFAYYEQSTSSDDVTFVELKRDAYGNPEHFQVNVKPDEGMANQAFRVKVFTNSGIVPDPDGDGFVRSWEEKVRFGLALFENSSAINVPDDWAGEVAGQNFPVKYVVEYQESDSFAVQVDCSGGTWVGLTAGVFIAENAFAECPGDLILVLVQERVELGQDEVCLPVGWEQDGPCYRWQLYRSLDGGLTYQVYVGYIKEESLTVAYCLAADPMYSAAELWSGFRTPAPYDTYVSPTINTPFDPYEDQFDCSLVQPQPAGLAGVVHRVRQLLGMGPNLLYAAHNGFGELVGGTRRLSHFGRARAQTLNEVSGDGQSGLINSTLPEPLVVRVLTIPHQEAHAPLGPDDPYTYETDPPAPVENQEVVFEVIAGDGMLTAGGQTADSLSVYTDADGYAQVAWMLGPDESPPEQKVMAYGPDFGPYGSYFGQLEGPVTVDSLFVFVDDMVEFYANAYNAVTDFLEPLDEKDGYSGDPITGIAPGVVICASAAGVADCDSFSQQFDETDIKLTEDSGRWFFQANWKPRDFGIAAGTFVVHIVLDGGVVVGESVEIVVEKGGKVELVAGQLQINPTTDLPIKFTLSRPAL